MIVLTHDIPKAFVVLYITVSDQISNWLTEI